MVGRRMRRWRTAQTHTVLPLRVTHVSNTISCWYCDLKISVLNEPLFRFGQRHARFLRVWFSVGTGFGLTALVGVTMILLWEFVGALHLYHENAKLDGVLTDYLFGFSPWVSSLRMSLVHVGYLLISTLISVSVHEFGHAIAAASEGIEIQYVAVFVALLFPGALVAFNNELLQALPRVKALHIYCAGVWHNAMCSAVCGLAMFSLPLILFPLYIHGNSPMVFQNERYINVLDVSSGSPLSGYLSPGDIILSLDEMHIHNSQEWMGMASLIDKQTGQQNSHFSKDFKSFITQKGRKGYCVPGSLVEESKKILWDKNQSFCPDDLVPFTTISCSDAIVFDGDDKDDERRKSMHCLTAMDIVKLRKCGDGWVTTVTNGTSCACSEDEFCLTLGQLPSLNWVEITYLRPNNPECLQLEGIFETSDFQDSKCGGTFVFIGDVISMVNSVSLTAYRPRWASNFGAYIPSVLEKILSCTFHVSLTLALLNSLPVYALDGESILEVTLCYFTFLSPKKRRIVLQAYLLGGTIISIFAVLRIFRFSFSANQRLINS